MATETAPRETNPASVKVRWWPAWLILALATVRLAVIWFGEASQLQDRVVPTMMLAMLVLPLLALWLFFLSRLPWATRGRLFLGLVVVVAAFIGLFEVRGFSGDLIPDIRFRWGGGELQTEAKGQADPVTFSPTDFPQFLGPHRNAVIDHVQLATDWQSRPPKELWRQAVGDAWSSFVIVGDDVLTQEQRGDQEAVVRYELETGNLVWTYTYSGQFESVVGGNGPRATPTVAGDHVYSLGSSGVLSAITLAVGQEVWQRDLVAEHGATPPEWRYAASPLVVEDLVIVAPGGAGGHSVAAYNRFDGNLVWHAGDDPAAYASPALLTILGREQIVVRHLGSVTGHDPVDGSLLWRVPWPGQQPNVAQPLLLGDDRLLISSGYGIGAQLLQFELGEAGDLAPTVAWESPRMKAKFTNMVSYDGAVFGLDDGVLVSLDPSTGERNWKKGRYGHGQLLLVGKHLLILSEQGDLVLLEANPLEHRELARIEALGDKSWNTPALAGEYLLLRNAGEAVCYRMSLAS